MWTGNTATGTLDILPEADYQLQPACPWCQPAAGARSSSRARRAATRSGSGTPAPSPAELWLTGAQGSGHLLITDGQGQQMGYSNGQLLQNIPGGYASEIAGGLGVETEPNYTLPLTQTYPSIALSNAQSALIDLTQFGPGYADGISGLLPAEAGDQAQFANDGTQLAYRPHGTRSVTLTLAFSSTGSQQIAIGSAGVGAGQALTTTNNLAAGTLAFSERNAGGGTYTLSFQRQTATGTQIFWATGIAIAATDTHVVDYGAWSGQGPMTIGVEHGSNGTIAQTLTVPNQEVSVYLPLLEH